MKTTPVRFRPALRTLVSLALFLALATGPARAAAQAKSVILLIGDGMGPMTVKAASIRLRGADGRLAMQNLPVKGSLCTTSFGGEVTDSAAAATALATGYKTKNGMIGMTADNSLVRSILEACRDVGKATGLVATSSITHATPAGFASHVTSRGSEYDIASQLVANRVNVLLGGGKSFFLTPTGDAWIGVDFKDAAGRKLGGWSERMRWMTDQEAERTFLTPPGAAQASLWIWRGGALDAFFDDFKLEPKKGESATAFVNGDFEKGNPGGWNVWSGCEVVRDGASMALRVSSGGGCDQTVPVDPDREYSFSYRGRIYDPEAGKPDRRLPWDEAARVGYVRIEKKGELAGAAGPYVLGLFGPGAMENTPEEPTLAEMAGKAFDLLGRESRGFFLMVEGSQIDWAAHGNDAEGVYRQMESFDDTVRAAVAFAKKKGNVLVVVTADHETGGVSAEGSDAKTLKLAFSTTGHTATRVPLFAFGPGSKAFAGPHDNSEVPGLIAKALGILF